MNEAVHTPVEWVRLQLDLDSFDDVGFRLFLKRRRQVGLAFTRLAELGVLPSTGGRRRLGFVDDP